MKSDEKIVAEAVRMEYSEKDGKLFIVFEIKEEKYKQELRKNWADSNIEYKLINNFLVKEEE